MRGRIILSRVAIGWKRRWEREEGHGGGSEERIDRRWVGEKKGNKEMMSLNLNFKNKFKKTAKAS